MLKDNISNWRLDKTTVINIPKLNGFGFTEGELEGYKNISINFGFISNGTALKKY